MFTQEELTIIKDALSERSSRLLADVEAYRGQGNKEALKDVLFEWKKVRRLHTKVFTMLLN